MIPNLYHLSSTKQKLSSEELGHGPGMIPRHKILMALMVDLFIVAAVSSLLTSLISLSLGSYFSTPTLQKVWSLMRFNFLSLATLSVTAVSYFSLCYFLNDGQSAGARMMGLRRSVKFHHAGEAFREALSTLGVYLSFGFSVRSFSMKMHRHDFRYQKFLGFREMRAPNLVHAIEAASLQDEKEETRVAA